MNIYNKTTIPYFYIIRNKLTGIMYAGSKWEIGCSPDKFMTTTGYKTSSPKIKSIICDYGLDIFEILRIDTYCDNIHVHEYETIFLRTNDCANSNNWYNKHNNSIEPFGSIGFKCMMLDKYGAEYANQTNLVKEKTKKTCMQRYGHEYTFQVPDIKEKIKQKIFKCYGVENISHSLMFKEKAKQTWNKNFGYDHPAKCPEIKEKTKKTCVERYGVEYSLQSELVREKASKTIKETYGVDNVSQSAIVKEKKKHTLLQKYGVDHNSKIKKQCDYCGELKNLAHQTQCKLNPNRKKSFTIKEHKRI